MVLTIAHGGGQPQDARVPIAIAQVSDRAFFVRCGETGISHDVGDNDGGQLSLGRRGGHGIRFGH